MKGGQGLLRFYKPPTMREKLENRAEAPLRSTKGQKALPKSGLFSTVGFAKPRECSATRMAAPISLNFGDPGSR
jgi:hypothetical protein